MKLDENKFAEGLIAHKKQIAELGRLLKSGLKPRDKEVRQLYARVHKSGRELALAHSEFKCEKTGKTDRLQFHHMIGRENKKLTSFYKYATQRYYWANIIILNQEHHDGNFNDGEFGCITEEFKDKVKKKYFKVSPESSAEDLNRLNNCI